MTVLSALSLAGNAAGNTVVGADVRHQVTAKSI